MSRNKDLYYFVLSGSYYSLAEEELDALFDINNVPISESAMLTQLRLVSSAMDTSYIKNIIERAGAVSEGGVVIGLYSTREDVRNVSRKISKDLLEYFGDVLEECWISIKCIRGFNKEYLATILNNVTRIVCRKTRYKAGSKISIISTDGVIVVGIPVAKLDTKSFLKRRPPSRPFFRSVAMPPQLSRILVNLSRLRPGEYFLDPFAGTGSILIEAYLVGGKPIGIDIDWEMVRGARLNLKYYGMTGAEVFLSDAKEIPLERVDAVATDPPYGRSASTHGETIHSIYRQFIKAVGNILAKKKYMVFMAPTWLEKYVDKLLCKEDFLLKRKHYIYVHGSLTRIVYEVVKI